MPVYEFYCPDCHAVFSFLARCVITDRRPACPRCLRPALDRQVSRFAISRNRPEQSDDSLPDIDEARLEKAMLGLASETEGLDENDPRQMARIMKKFADATGMDLESGMGEAIRRLEAGEDPETLETEMGHLFDDASISTLFGTGGLNRLKQRLAPPAHDEALYRFE